MYYLGAVMSVYVVTCLITVFLVLLPLPVSVCACVGLSLLSD